jgi:hypothetical protein
MKIDREWSVNGRRQFAWWGHRLAQRIWADPPFDDEGIVITRLHARTDLINNFRPDPRRLGDLAFLMRRASLSGLVRDTRHPDRLQLACSMYAHAESSEWVQRAFSLAVACQVDEAEGLVDGLAELLGGQVAASCHPQSGPRHVPDDMLGVLTSMVIPEGAGPSAFPGPYFEQAREMMEQNCFLATGDESALTVEFPFGDFTSLCQMQTKEEHPWLGRGLLVRLTLPTGRGDDAERAEQALYLNGRELQELTRAHFLGSWCPSSHGLTYVTFFPNYWSRAFPGFVPLAAMGTRNRAHWAAGVFGVSWEPEATLRRKVERLQGGRIAGNPPQSAT